MLIQSFSVTNYKIFKEKFTINLNKNDKNAVSILTGKNNCGKSALLEAIYEFHREAKKSNGLTEQFFNEVEEPIILEAEITLNEELVALLFDDKLSVGASIIVKKEYKTPEQTAKYTAFYNDEELESKAVKELEKYLNAKIPYYIKPTMTVSQIDEVITNVYYDFAVNQNKKKVQELQTKIESAIKVDIDKLKKSLDEELTKIEEDVSATLRFLFPNQSLSLHFESTSMNSISIDDLIKKSHTKLLIHSDTKSEMSLAEQGTGVQRMSLIYTMQKILANPAMNANERMLLVDEPEAFLHPEAIRGLSRSLYEIGEHMDVVISTHSPVLIRLENDHTVIEVFRINVAGAVALFNSGNRPRFDDDDLENIKMLNYADSYVNEFFFSSKNIIVEGDTEKIVLEYILNEYPECQYHIISARGKSTIPILMKILNQFQSDYYVLHDLDCLYDGKANDAEKILKTELTKCKKIGAQITQHSKIFACHSNFELAFYGKKVTNANKVKNIWRILHDETSDIRKQILGAFNDCFDLDIGEFKKEKKHDRVVEITNQEDYEQYFDIKSLGKGTDKAVS